MMRRSDGWPTGPEHQFAVERAIGDQIEPHVEKWMKETEDEARQFWEQRAEAMANSNKGIDENETAEVQFGASAQGPRNNFTEFYGLLCYTANESFIGYFMNPAKEWVDQKEQEIRRDHPDWHIERLEYTLDRVPPRLREMIERYGREENQ